MTSTVAGRVFKIADAEDGFCPKCWPAEEARRKKEEAARVVEEMKAVAAEEKLQRDRALVKMLGGPALFEDYRLEKFNRKLNPHAYDATKKFDNKTNLFLHGECGSGKTHLAVGRMIELADQGLDVYFFRTPTLMRRVRYQDASVEEAVIEELSRYDVLVWDDAGVGKGTEFMIQIIYEIVERRMANRRNGLIVTSNLFFDKLAEQIGDDRLASRLQGLCKGHVVNCGEQDRR